MILLMYACPGILSLSMLNYIAEYRGLLQKNDNYWRWSHIAQLSFKALGAKAKNLALQA